MKKEGTAINIVTHALDLHCEACNELVPHSKK